MAAAATITTTTGGTIGSATTTTAAATHHPQRSYNTRLSTVSVTQLLSDSCSSLLNRIANRVRGPSVHTLDQSRNRRSKGPTSSVREKANLNTVTTPDPSASSYTPRRYNHNDLARSSTAGHLADRLESSKYWRSGEDVNRNVVALGHVDSSKRWLTVPSYAVKCDRERERGRDRDVRLATRADVPEWRQRSFANHHSRSSKRLGLEDSVAVAEPADGGRLRSYNLGTTRSRLEDKYYDVLEKSASSRVHKQRPLTKSATSVVLSEKAYPFVATATAASSRRGKTREHTPYREEKTRSEHRHKSSSRRETVLYSFKPLKGEGRESANASSRLRLHSSSKELSRSRRDSPHVSVAKSPGPDKSDRTARRDKITRTKSCVQADFAAAAVLNQTVATLEKPALSKVQTSASAGVDKLKPPENHERLSSSTSDREIKRKEIQALIEKYTGLEEQTVAQELPSVLVKCQKKYSAVLSTATADAVGELVAKAVSVGFLLDKTRKFERLSGTWCSFRLLLWKTVPRMPPSLIFSLISNPVNIGLLIERLRWCWIICCCCYYCCFFIASLLQFILSVNFVSSNCRFELVAWKIELCSPFVHERI